MPDRAGLKGTLSARPGAGLYLRRMRYQKRVLARRGRELSRKLLWGV